MSLDVSIGSLRAGYREGTLTPTQVVEVIQRRIAERGDDGVWITTSERLRADATALDQADPENKPLWGMPFAVKDNIDVAGLPTTAGCPAFTYAPAESSSVVAKLIDAGALVVGKTNLDQFATRT